MRSNISAISVFFILKLPCPEDCLPLQSPLPHDMVQKSIHALFDLFICDRKKVYWCAVWIVDIMAMHMRRPEVGEQAIFATCIPENTARLHNVIHFHTQNQVCTRQHLFCNVPGAVVGQIDSALHCDLHGQIRCGPSIHGKGTGKLRVAVRDALQRHVHIKSYETGDDKEGGEGVTVAKLHTG